MYFAANSSKPFTKPVNILNMKGNPASERMDVDDDEDIDPTYRPAISEARGIIIFTVLIYNLVIHMINNIYSTDMSISTM